MNDVFSSLAGQLLLAMPQMGDPRFHRAAIFLCTHDAKGAMGLVLNHVLPDMDFGKLLKQLNIQPVPAVPHDVLGRPVVHGGPVETGRGFLLHGKDFITPETVHVNQNFSVSGTVTALRAVARGHGPKNMVFTLGYAVWAPGQLENEILDNAWLTLPATPDLVFGPAPLQVWERGMAALRIDPAMLSHVAGRA